MVRLTPEDIRREALTAIFSHDAFFNHGALKGGTALELALKIGTRSSLDIDISIEGDFEDVATVMESLERLMREHFATLDHRLFDYSYSFQPPRDDVPDDWGGYRIEFKVVPIEWYREDDRNVTLRRAVEYHHRKFKMDISRSEYIGVPLEIDVGSAVTWRVYTPTLIVCEKLRAICQQLPSYATARHLRPRRRPRDFYDVHAVMTSDSNVDASSEPFREALRQCFAAKVVAPSLLSEARTEAVYEFHLGDWDSVTNAVAGSVQGFRFYFDYVTALIESDLRPFWEE